MIESIMVVPREAREVVDQDDVEFARLCGRHQRGERRRSERAPDCA